MTGLKMVLGTAQFSAGYGVLGELSGTNPNELLDMADRIGVDALDTSPMYGKAEEIIGASGWAREIHTKFLRFDSIEDFKTASLRHLKRDFVDVLYAHDSRFAVMEKENLKLVHSHLVPTYARNLGVSVYTREEFLAALDIPEVSHIQFPHNILDRAITLEHRQRAVSAGKVLMARSLFLQGLLSKRPRKTPATVCHLSPYLQTVYSFASNSGFSLVELMVAWLNTQSGIEALVFGSNNIREMVEVVEAVRSDRVPAALLSEMEESIRCPPKRLVDPRNW